MAQSTTSAVCRSSWHIDTAHRPSVGDRIIRCELPAGHEGDHDELIDGEAGVVTWPRRKATPRVWQLPPEPGAEVTAVRSAHARWKRERYNTGDRWLLDTYPAPRDAETWAELVAGYGPLTDASDEVTP